MLNEALKPLKSVVSSAPAVLKTESILADASHNADPDHVFWRRDLYISPAHVDGTSVSLLEALAWRLARRLSPISLRI
jgi:hypothetical protein